jgi:hypothetical protein
MDFLSFIPTIGEGISWVTQKVIQQLSTWGLAMTALQVKILLIIIFGGLLYLFFAVITFAKKILKWGLIVLIIFLTISVAVSMFT